MSKQHIMKLCNAWSLPDNPPSQPDCFVILSYAVKNAFTPTRPTRAEIELAYAWWQRFPHAKLIMSTGDNQGLGTTNARVMANYAVSLGIPREYIIEEDRSRNTYENLVCTAKIVQAGLFRQPTLVTLDLYTRRAVEIARKVGWVDFYWLSAFAQGEPAYGYKWLQTSSRTTIFCYEVLASIFCKLAKWA